MLEKAPIALRRELGPMSFAIHKCKSNTFQDLQAINWKAIQFFYSQTWIHETYLIYLEISDPEWKNNSEISVSAILFGHAAIIRVGNNFALFIQTKLVELEKQQNFNCRAG